MKLIRLLLFSLAILVASISCKLASLTSPRSSQESSEHIQDNISKKLLTGEFRQIGNLPSNYGQTSEVKLSFADEKYGWLVNSRELWRTRDGGMSWKVIFLFNAQDSLLECELVRPNEGWICSANGLYKTENDGDTWTNVVLPNKGRTDSFLDLKFFPDGKHGLVAGQTIDEATLDEPLTNDLTSSDGKHGVKPLFYITEDAGKSWERMGVKDADYDSVREIFITGNFRAWAMAVRGVLAYDGSSWKYVEFELPTCNQSIDPMTLPYGNLADQLRPISVDFFENLYGWMTFRNGQLAKSEDGGKTWCVIPHSVDNWPKFYMATDASRIHFTDSQNGWWWVEHSLYHTKDSGKSWFLFSDNVDAMSFVEADQMFILSGRQIWKGNARRP